MEKDIGSTCPDCGSTSFIEWQRVTTDSISLNQTKITKVICRKCGRVLPDRRKNAREDNRHSF